MILNFLRQRLLMEIRQWLQLWARSFTHMMADKGFTHAAAIAYYMIVSIFPLLLFLIGVLGFLLEGSNTQRHILLLAGRYLPSGSLKFIQENITSIIQARGPISIISTVGMLWSSTFMFDEINQAINAAWGIHKPERFIESKIKSVFIILCLLLIILCSVLLTTQAALFERFGSFFLQFSWGEWLWGIGGRFLSVLSRTISAGLAVAAFTLAYLFLPRVKVSIRDVWLGALFASLFWELLKRAFVCYVTTIANYTQVYGSISAVLVLLIWTDLSALILIWGAEFAAEYSRIRRASLPLQTR